MMSASFDSKQTKYITHA